MYIASGASGESVLVCVQVCGKFAKFMYYYYHLCSFILNVCYLATKVWPYHAVIMPR